MTKQEANCENDIGLSEVFTILWSGRIIITIIFLFTILCGVAYSLLAQTWWTSNAVITIGQFKEYSGLKKQANKITSIISDDEIKEDINFSVSSDELFHEYLITYNSYNNKKSFVENNSILKSKIKDNNIINTNDIDNFNNLWAGKITSVLIDKDKNEYMLSMQSNYDKESFELLTQYVNYTNGVVRRNVTSEFNLFLDKSKVVVDFELKKLEQKALNMLKNEKLKSQYSLMIAEAAAINEPVALMKYDPLFSIEIGSKALKEKVKILDGIKDYSLYIPEINELKFEQKALNKIIFDDDVKFKSFRYLQDISYPISKDKPKRKLIVILSAMLGLIVGSCFVLLRSGLNR